MSLVHSGAFMAHFAQCKVSAKQQVNSMIDAIYAKVLLDLELWLNKHESNDSIKSEIDSDCEENVTHHNNLPGQSQFDHQNNLQNELSLSSTINTESAIKQEYDDEAEEVGEGIDDDKCENFEKEIFTSGDHAEIGESGDESSGTTQCNIVDVALQNIQINQLIISNDILHQINTEPLIKQEYLHGSSITSIPLDFVNNAALNDIFIDEQIEGQKTQIQTDEIDNHNYGDYNEVSEEECLNNPNCANEVKGLLFEEKNNNKNFIGDVFSGDVDKTNFDEAPSQIDFTVTNNTQMNNQNDGQNDINERFACERNMERTTTSTSGVRPSTLKQIQPKVLGDLIQSNVNHRKCGKRPNDQANKSVKKVKRKNVLDDDEDSDDQEDHANNAIGEQSATQSTTDSVQPNLAQPNRRFQCADCPKSFVSNFHFQAHLRVHSGERPFHCDQCGQPFSVKRNLTQHQLIHQNIKNFQCPECDKQFTRKPSLDSHLRIHSGERPFACRHCEMSFTQLKTRNKHEQAIHLHVKSYRCKQCDLTVTQRSTLITHIRMVHFGLPHTIKQQHELNIVDNRDPRELVEKV